MENWPPSPVGRKPLMVALVALVAPPRGNAVPPRQPASALAQAILARPLFMSSRRPASTAPARPGIAAGLPRLSGVVVAGAYRRAIFERAGKASILAVGDRLDAGRIVAITSDTVTVGVGGRDQIMRPGYDLQRPVPAAPGLSILERLGLHRASDVPLPKPPSLEQLERRLPPR